MKRTVYVNAAPDNEVGNVIRGLNGLLCGATGLPRALFDTPEEAYAARHLDQEGTRLYAFTIEEVTE